jgi:hypothetical protein
LNGTFRDPASDVLQGFTNIGTIIGDKVYSIIYYSPAETYPVYNTIYDKMIKSFEVIPQKSSAENPVATSTYVNSTYGIRLEYPSDWTIHFFLVRKPEQNIGELTYLLFCGVSIYALFKIKNEITFPAKITEAIKVGTQCHYVMAAWTFNFLIY